MKDHATTPANLDAVLRDAAPAEVAGLRAAWEQADGLYNLEAPDPAAAERVWHALETHTQAPLHNRKPRRRPGRRRVWMAAGVAALTVAVGAVLWLQPVVQHAPPGERMTVVLPDGSQAELNSGATLRYARRFGTARAVRLDGEAFFDVAPDARPFVVETFNARVTVLGTRFNVRAWSQSMDPNTTVTLEEGRVMLSPLDRPAQTVALEPGQRYRVAPAMEPPDPPDPEAAAQATAWRHGDLVFKDQWLGVILEEVERRFAIRVTVQPRAVRQKRLNLALRNPANAEAVLRDVCVALGLNYRETARGYEIYTPA